MEAMSKGLGPSGPEPSYSRANDDSNSKSRRTRFEQAADPTHLRKGNPCRLDGLVSTRSRCADRLQRSHNPNPAAILHLHLA